MKRIISAMVVAGALVQAASAMGPAGDNTHRHFYKDQQWIWQGEQSLTKPHASKAVSQKFSDFHVWQVPLAFMVPTNPPPPPLAFLVPPRRDSVAFLVPPRRDSVAFLVPPRRDSVAFLIAPRHESTFLVLRDPTGA